MTQIRNPIISHYNQYIGIDFKDTDNEILQDALTELKYLHKKCCNVLVENLLEKLIQSIEYQIKLISKLNKDNTTNE